MILNSKKAPLWFKEIIKYLMFIFYKDKRTLRSNLKYKNTKIGKRAFLIATGPSINKLDLNYLKSEDCFTISNAFLHDKIEVISPIFHIFAPYHEPLVKENYIEWLKKADNVLPPSTKILLGHKTREMVAENKIFQSREIAYMYLGNPFYYNINLKRQVPSPKTGTHQALNMLIYMGYSEIYLIGCDHNILKFYGGKREHFYTSDQDKRVNVDYWTDITDNLKSELDMFNKYKRYLKLANKKNIKIYNLSKESWLNFIDYKDFDEVLKKGEKNENE